MTHVEIAPEMANETSGLTAFERAELEKWLARYPEDRRQSAVLGALRAVMHEDHYLSVTKMDAVAEYLGISAIAVYEVASFYSMFELDEKAAAKYSISVCTNVSCMLNGSDQILSHIEGKLGIKLGDATTDKRFFLKREEECLAACCGAPMMQVNHVYHTDLTPEKVDDILDGLA
uniref:NADH-quinone oxidoreductase subunit E n=1 Tax=uncultured Thiotrichaceae bacterium TaxID=298394 RepID=A0A6S6UN45_9GAMM|nr:MAG: NADH-ubiquinone oxidoreductase chain E (EC [uncultured Thiotrichaceae bacterium]